MRNSSRRISERVLAVILSVLLMVGMLPASVFAAVPGTHEGVFTFTVTDGENPVSGAEVAYTVTTQKDGEEPVISAEEKVSAGTDGVAEITANLPATLESDVVITVNYTVNAAGYTAVTGAHTVTSLTDNVAVTMSAVPTVDVTATIVGKGSVTVGGTVVDAENTVRVPKGTVNAVAVTPGAGYEISALSIGGTEITIDDSNKGGYTDAAYQFDAATAINVTFVDVAAPVISLVEAAPNGWTNVDKTVTVTASDNSDFFTVYYYFTADGETAVQEAANGSFTAVRLGSYTVYAVDATGNRCAEQTIEVTQVDKDAPAVDSISGDPSKWEAEATIRGGVSDAADGSGVSRVVFGTSDVFENAADVGVSFDAAESTYSFTVNENGTYYVWAVDAAGNHSEPKSIAITKIDNTDPTITATANPATWTNGIIKVEIVASDAQSNVTVKYSDIAAGDIGAADATKEGDKWIFNIEKDTDGTYTYYVWALDEVGHQKSVEVTVYYDGTAPIVAITPLSSTDWTNQDVTITGTVDGVTESATVSGLDKVVYGTDADPKNVTGVAIAEGLNYSFTVATNGTYHVWSLDKAGNYSEVATITINHIDKMKPEVAVDKDEYAWSKDSVTVSGTAVDANSGIDAVWYNTTNSLSGATKADEISGESYSFVVPNDSNVNTTYYIWSEDTAGNYSDPVTTKVQIDVTKPVITAKAETTGSGKERKTVVSGIATDADSGIKGVVYAAVNDIEQATNDGVTLNPDGSYAFTVPGDKNFNGAYYIWAEDNVGNINGVASEGITVDVVAPVIVRLEATPDVNDPNIWTNGAVVVSGTASDSADATYNSSIKEVKFATEDDISKATSDGVTLNSDGSFSFVVSNDVEFNGYYFVWAIDAYDNESESSKIAVKIDTTAPTAKIEINGRFWTTLLNALTFGLFSNTQLDVTIEAKDVNSEIANGGVAKIEYYKATNDEAVNPLSRETLAAFEASAWTVGDALTVSGNEVFVVYVKVTDNAGNIDYFCSGGAVVDSMDVVIELTPSDPVADNGNPDVYGYYNSDVTVKIKATEMAPYSGIKSVEYWVTTDGNETKRDMPFNFTKEEPQFNELVSFWEDDIIIDADENNSCNVILTVKVIDNAGNETEKSISLDIDKTAPVVSVAYNNHEGTQYNDRYYNDSRTATIAVTERSGHFAEPAVYINQDVPEGVANYIHITALDANGKGVAFDPVIEWVPAEDQTDTNETVYTANIDYDVDTNYTFEISVMDKAANVNKDVDVDPEDAPYVFTVAKEVPAGSVSVRENTWYELLNVLTFGLYSNDKLEVVTTASHKTSPIKIEYYKAANEEATTLLTWDQLDDITGWTLVVDSGENEVRDMPVLTVERDELFVVYLKISNYAGGYTYISTDGAIVDTTGATIQLTPSAPAADNGDPEVYGYYNDDVTINVEVTDPTPYSGIKFVEYWVTADGNETKRDTLFDFAVENPQFDELVGFWEDEIVIDADENNSCDVVVYVKVVDNAGNESINSVALDIDVTAPTIKVTYSDESPVNGKYFKDSRTAVISVTECGHHFAEPTVYINPETPPENDPNCVIIYALNANGEPVAFKPEIKWDPVVNEDNHDNTVYTANVLFDADANYTFEIRVMDRATNQNTVVDTGTSIVPYSFAVDGTPPAGSASIGTSVWDELLDALTFGLYTNEKFDVLASANDEISPLRMEYYKVSGEKAATVLTEAELDALTTWTLLVDDGEHAVKDLHTLTVSEDEQFVVYFKITDYAGNYSYICTDGAIVETTPPVVDEPAPEITITPEQPINGLYNGDVKVDIKVTDPLSAETFSGLKTVSYRVLNMGKVTQNETLYNIADEVFDGEKPRKDELRQEWTDTIVVQSKLNNSNDVVVEVYAEDNAGNTSMASVAIKIDVTAPRINISYNNNNPDSGRYYNTDRVATVTITERNFNPEDVVVTIKNTLGTIPTISGWTKNAGTGNGDNTTHTATIVYRADGDYTFSIAYTDLADNECPGESYAANTQNPAAFTIDQTAPVVQVSYDNNKAENGNYFDAARTATITIIERNFDVNRVNFTQTTGRGVAVSGVTWVNQGNTHIATISYTADGEYTFDDTMTDMAGNSSGDADYGDSVAGKHFVIDTTFEDMITIGGVEGGKAYGYGDDVIPTIDISDINLEKYTVSLVGVQKDTVIDLTKEVTDLLSADAGNVTGVFDIFDVVQDMDGIYTLSVTAQDKAGNQDAEEITFTVNRFGSVYLYDEYLMELISDGGAYVQGVTNDLIINEYNADRLIGDSLVIEITCDGKPLENVIYEVTPEINSTVAIGESGWYQYKYTISKDNFVSDGVYKISVSTKDATGNTPENNRYEDLGITFHVDSTPAEISSIVGLEEAIINATEREVKYTVYDTMGIQSVRVYVNGELAEEITDFGADLNNYSGSFTLSEQSAAQTVRIVVEDMSGNITDTDAENFSSAYAFNRSVTVSTNIFVRWYANKPLFWGSIGGTAAVVGGLWFFLTAKRKKKETKKATAK